MPKVKRYFLRYLPLGYLPFYQQGYYPIWFEFSQNFRAISQICE